MEVRADNTYRRGAWWAWGGISRSVSLVANNDVRIAWQHITAVPDLQTKSAAVQVKYKLVNAGDRPQAVDLESTLDSVPGFRLGTRVTLPPRSETVTTTSTTIAAKDVRLWHFDHPSLYTLTTRIAEQGKPLHAKSDRFGIRRIEVKPDGLYLNGERIRVVGYNRVGDSNTHGNTEPDALVHTDVDLMKSGGAVFSRLMHTPVAPNMLDYLDQKGMLIFAEIPVWGGGDPQVKKDNPLTRQWLTEMIVRDYNHPCIIGWSPANETTGHYTYVQSMFDFIREDLDSSRLLSYASDTVLTGKKDPIDLCDVAMINSYNNFAQEVDATHKRWPDKPVFFSEWGRRQIGASSKAEIPDFEKGLSESFRDRPYVIGLSIWTFNDYRSDFKGTPKSGNREWGVVDVDRRPKAAYYQARKAFSPVREITLNDQTIRITPRGPQDVPSYTLRGYRLQWEGRDAAGAARGGTINLPDLKPGDPQWEAAVDVATLTGVKLITPTGYTVDDRSAESRP